MKSFFFLLSFLSVLGAEESTTYELGHGFKLSEALRVGAYLSTEYEATETERVFAVDDIAVLAYGLLTPQLSYMAEFEAVKFYQYDFRRDTEESNHAFHIERMYFDYRYSDFLGARIGKQITPIGYWNLQPINVLRDTTSNPYYAGTLFPRFLTGIDLNGYVTDSFTTQYHFFAQKNEDLDETYINIPNEHFFGAAIEHELNERASIGGSVGQFKARSSESFTYAQINAKYEHEGFLLISEFMLRHGGADEKTMGGYAQAVYHFAPEHAMVSRYEYFDDNADQGKDQVYLLGYSYRPIYPVSLKAEYQWHEQQERDKFLASFSVLF